MTAKELDDTLKAIAANAKAMRDAGVTGEVVIGDITFTLAGDEPPAVAAPAALPDQKRADPIDDPDTFGTDGVPQRRKPMSRDAMRAEFEKE